MDDPKASDSPTPERETSPTDGQLVAAVLGGRREAFDVLIHRYQRQAVAVSYRLLGNTQDSLEVTQEAFLKAFTSLDTLQKPDAFGGWLMRIVSNLSLNFRRGRKLRQQGSLNDLMEPSDAGRAEAGTSEWMSASADPLRGLESQEMGQRLKEALDSLPDKQRLAIVLFALEGLSQKEVAETLKCSIEAVKWHVFQGRKRLRELLKDHL